MASDLKYTAKVENGNVKIFGRANFDADMKAYEGQRISISVKRYRKTRSGDQNEFYWGYFIQSQIDCFKERWGYSYSKDQVHDWNKANFWCEEHIDEETGECIKLPASSTDKTTTEWEETLDRMRTWFMLHFDWPLPFPNEQATIF